MNKKYLISNQFYIRRSWNLTCVNLLSGNDTPYFSKSCDIQSLLKQQRWNSKLQRCLNTNSTISQSFQVHNNERLDTHFNNKSNTPMFGHQSNVIWKCIIIKFYYYISPLAKYLRRNLYIKLANNKTCLSLQSQQDI